MNKSSYRLILKELAIIKIQEPRLSLYLKTQIKCCFQKQDINRIKDDLKKKIIAEELSKSFLKLLKMTNSQCSFKSYKSRLKLITIFTGLNQFVDSSFRFRQSNKSLQMKFLEQNNNFRKLPLINDQQFVRKMIKKIYQGEQKKEFTNLSNFLQELKIQQSNCKPDLALKMLLPQMKQYIQQIITLNQNNVSEKYMRIYKHLFTQKTTPQYETIIDSYLQSCYISLDI